MRVFPRVDRIAPRLPLEKSYSALIATPFGWSRAASRNQPPWQDRTRTPLHAATVCTLCIRVKNVFADLRRGRQLHLSTKSDPNRRKHHGRLAIKRHADVTRVARRLPSPTTVPNQAPRAARAVATAGVDRRCLAPARERRMACASSSRTSSSISAAPKTRATTANPDSVWRRFTARRSTTWIVNFNWDEQCHAPSSHSTCCCPR
jgi:hypothetical protein